MRKFLDKVINYFAKRVARAILQEHPRTYHILTRKIEDQIAEQMLQDKSRICATKNDLTLHALSFIKIEGLYLEFGVFEGTSINFVADHINPKTIHGFDSFEGFPEGEAKGFWKQYDDDKRFDRKGTMPDVRDNVTLHKGWFDETLPTFIKDNPSQVAFLHIDCDIYTSTKTIFDTLKNQIKPGSVISFDEYCSYPGFEQEEYMAFQEFIEDTGYRYKYLAYCLSDPKRTGHGKVALMIEE